MHTTFLILFACLTITAAVPTGIVDIVPALTAENHVQVIGIVGIVRVILLLALQYLVRPIIRAILHLLKAPFNLIGDIIFFPINSIHFILSIPRILLGLPKTLLLLPVNTIRLVAQTIAILIGPIVKISKFIFSIVKLLLGIPVEVFNTVYVL